MDKLLSSFAFKFNSRHYSKGFLFESETDSEVGRCRLPVSKPELEARLVSEYWLETKM